MNKLIFLLILFTTAFVSSCKEERDPLEQTRDFVKTQIDTMTIHLKQMKADVAAGKDIVLIHKSFNQARKYYKRVEAVNEFYYPGFCEFLNGPALDEADEYDDKETEATGFQVVEELIFPQYDPAEKNSLLQELDIMLASEGRYDGLHTGLFLTRENLFESVRLELLRVSSLGLSGFDSPIAQRSLPEASDALEGIKIILSFFKSNNAKELENQIDAACKYLTTNTTFNEFNRGEFLISYLNPLAEAIADVQKSLGVTNNSLPIVVNLEASTFFGRDMFNKKSFMPHGAAEYYNKQTINLGKSLFFDPVLSGNRQRSCASCHVPDHGFAEERAKSEAFDSRGTIDRNAPSLINAVYQRSQFWDQRIHFFEDQITDVVRNEDEMHGDLEYTVSLLNQSDEYKSMFKKAFGETTEISSDQIRRAIASYIRSLEGMNSRFDQYLRGDRTKVTDDELAGFNLFMGKAKCATCHFMPLFNGTVPPNFVETEAEVLGVPDKNDTIHAKLDSDLGKYRAYSRNLFRFAFKTPTVRNAELTAPYMHNGVFKTLEEVLDFYNRGGGAGIGIDLKNQTLPTEKLNLSGLEKRQIIMFIKSLTDTTGITSKPHPLPKFNQPTLDARLVGGKY